MQMPANVIALKLPSRQTGHLTKSLPHHRKMRVAFIAAYRPVTQYQRFHLHGVDKNLCKHQESRHPSIKTLSCFFGHLYFSELFGQFSSKLRFKYPSGRFEPNQEPKSEGGEWSATGQLLADLLTDKPDPFPFIHVGVRCGRIQARRTPAARIRADRSQFARTSLLEGDPSKDGPFG